MNTKLKHRVLILYFLVLILPFVFTLFTNEEVVDEGWWISSGNTYLRLFLKCDFTNELWFNNYFQEWSWMNPQLGKYMVGIPLHIAGYAKHNFTYFYYKSDDKNFQWNLEHGRIPPKNILILGRIPGMICGYLCCVLLFFIGKRTNLILGMLTSSYVAFNQYFLKNSVRAFNDAPYILFSLICIYYLLQFNQEIKLKQRIRKIIFYSILIAISLSFAISTKYLGGISLLFVLFYIIFTSVMYLCFSKTKAKINMFKCLFLLTIIILLLTPTIFYILNPQFYERPITRFINTLVWWEKHNSMHQRNSPHQALHSFQERLTSTTELTLIKKTTTNYFLKLPFAIEILFFLSGIFTIIKNRFHNLKLSEGLSDFEIILLWFIFVFGVYSVWIPLIWSRYFLLPFITTPIIICLGFIYFFQKYIYPQM